MNQQNGDAYFSIVVGIEKVHGLSNWCGPISNDQLKYFIVAFKNGFGNQYFVRCENVPSADVNHNLAWKIAPYSSNGGGMLVQLFSQTYNGTGSSAAFFLSYALGASTNYTQVKREETVVGTVPTSHWVYGIDWKFAQYVHSDGTLAYQARDFDAKTFGSEPVLMYWNVVPAIGNQGGDLRTCIYGNGDLVCTIGG